jgi:hypothetical protein
MSFKILTSCMLFAALALFSAAGNADTGDSNRVIKATRASVLPVIDGRIGENEWPDATRASGFTDLVTGKAALEPTEAYISYDETYLYVAFKAYDKVPSGIIAREVLRDSRYSGGGDFGDNDSEDYLEVTLDPFLSAKQSDLCRFSVNALSTRSAKISGGRAGKAEWNGDWDAKATKTSAGWEAEMRIPWKTLSFPGGKKNLDFGLNFTRFQYRTRIKSQWSNTTPQQFLNLMGRWSQIEPPKEKHKPSLSLLPYALTTAKETGSQIRTGIDARYTVTPDFTIVSTINPDFATVESAVQTVAFSRAEQFVPERRPFFLEGANYFSAGSFYTFGPLFYSNRIGLFDIGAKAYGKITPKDTLGFLTAIDFGDRVDTIVRYRHDISATDQIGLFASQSDVAKDNDHSGVVALDGSLRRNKVGLDYQLIKSSGLNGGGGAADLNFSYQDSFNFTSVQLMNAGRNIRSANGLFYFDDFKGFQVYHNWSREWRKGAWRSFSVDFFPSYTWHQDGTPYQRGGGLGVQFDTRSDWRLSTSVNHNMFDAQKDATVRFGITSGATNRFRQIGMELITGQQADKAYRFYAPNVSWRPIKNLDVLYTGGLQQFGGWRRQHILTGNYILSRTRTIGGRILVQEEPGSPATVNPYISYREAGERGTETYLLLGAPNNKSFLPQVMVKLVFAR